MTELQNTILEMIAKGEPLVRTMGRLCEEVERLVPEALCSVLSVDAGRLRTLAAPGLPAPYCSAIDGLLVGPSVGSCGTAAFRGTEVITRDIEVDPLWSDFKHLALTLGLRACWSSPIFDSQGHPIATFAFYYSERRGPSQLERAIVDQCVNLCTIAFDRERRVLERERRASTDALTGLLNRSAFDTALSTLDCSGGAAWALCMIDLDNLKIVNDTFGHAEGDVLLQQVARSLRVAAAPNKVFRLGGDEYAIIVTSPEELLNLDAVIKGYLAALELTVEGDSCVVRPRATAGYALLSKSDETPQKVRQNADFALYHAKETAKGNAVRYWPGIGTRITRRLTAIREMDAALREQRIEAHYQPIIKLETGEVVGLEALARMRVGDTFRAASAFHEATTDASVADALTDHIIAQAAWDLRSWLDMGIPFQHLGINVSAADFHKGTLYPTLSRAFKNAGVPLKHVVLEITESVYMDDDAAVVRDTIARMRADGLKIALDDFGTGFASLTHLLSVPVDIIKIDKSFVDGVGSSTANDAVVGGIIRIASELGVEVVAEGIETTRQLKKLMSLGCKLGQGYYYSKALGPQAIASVMLEKAQGIAAFATERALD